MAKRKKKKRMQSKLLGGGGGREAVQSFVRGSSVSARRGAEAAGLGGFSEGRNWPRACLTWEDAYGRQGRVLNQFLAIG